MLLWTQKELNVKTDFFFIFNFFFILWSGITSHQSRGFWRNMAVAFLRKSRAGLLLLSHPALHPAPTDCSVYPCGPQCSRRAVTRCQRLANAGERPCSQSWRSCTAGLGTATRLYNLNHLPGLFLMHLTGPVLRTSSPSGERWKRRNLDSWV